MRLTTLAATALLVTAQVATVGVGPAAPAVGASISGLVTDGTADPIERVSVYLYDDGDIVDIVGTDGSGRFTLTGLSAGSYTVRFEDPVDTYAGEWFDDVPTESQATPVVLAAGEARTAVDASLAELSWPPVGSDVSGRVTTPTGAPASWIEVVAYRPGSPATVVGYTQTDRFGRYAFTDLVGGPVLVAAEPNPDEGDGYPFGLGLRRTWFGGATTSAAATPIAVPSAERDIVFRRSAGLSGRVTGPPSGHVVAFDAQQHETGWADVAADGTYELDFLDPDVDHRVLFVADPYVPQWYRRAPGFTSALAVPLTSGQVTRGIDAVLDPALVAREAPTIGGQPVVDGTLTATLGRWNLEDGVDFTQEWLADGRVVATGPSYRIKPAQAGTQLAHRVTAHYLGLVATSTSAPVVVPQVTTKLKVRAAYDRAIHTLSIKGTFTPRLAPVRGGHATVVDRLDPDLRDRVKLQGRGILLRLVHVRPGRHRFVVRFLGTRGATPARAVLRLTLR